jgi:hypothetical protein
LQYSGAIGSEVLPDIVVSGITDCDRPAASSLGNRQNRQETIKKNNDLCQV